MDLKHEFALAHKYEINIGEMELLLEEIRHCRVCEKHLATGINPVVAANSRSRILIIGQAPGRIVHLTSIPWNDKSGDNLRNWLGVDKAAFYNTDNFAIMPMGFCYPGTGKTGDLPPRSECAPMWHDKIISSLSSVQLTLLIGRYAQHHYLAGLGERGLTNVVQNFRDSLPKYFPLPHPSPRNNIWLRKNPWFAGEVLPELGKQVRQILTA